MESKKSRKILIISIVAVLLLIVTAGVTYTFFAMGVFKSDKQAFIECISDIGDKRIADYFEKVSNTPYENSGKFYVEISLDDFDKEKLEKVNDFNISFSGKADAPNSKAEQEISINYADDVNFPLKYVKTNSILGIETKYIGSKYLGVDTDSLGDFLNDVGVDQNTTNTLEDNLLKEDINYIYQTYMPIILENLTDDNFSKVKEDDQTGYILTITTTLVKNIATSLLENFKNDNAILEKLNIKSKDIDSIISNIQKINESSQNSIELAVYKENKKFKKLNIKINSNDNPVELNIEKVESDSDIQYIASIQLNQEELSEIKFTAKYSGLDTIQTVQESYEIGINGLLPKVQGPDRETIIAMEEKQINTLINEVKADKIINQDSSSEISLKELKDIINGSTDYENIEIEETKNSDFKITFTETKDEFVVNDEGKVVEQPEADNSSDEEDTQNNSAYSYIYKFENQISFKDSVDIEELNEDNTVVLNKQEEEYVTNLFNAIGERLQKVNSMQMKEIGFEENENPILYLIPGAEFIVANQKLGNMNNEMNELEIRSFNEKFEMYESTNTKGATVKGLLSTVQKNNEDEKVQHKIEEINFDGQEYKVIEQNITLIKSEINVEDNYKVEFEKNEDTGLIFRIVINKK